MTVRGPSVLRNAIANWSAFLCAAVVSFFLAPYVVHSLGNSAYGIWVLLGSLVGYLGLLDFGVRGAVTRFVAAMQAKNDHRGASSMVAAALQLFAVLGVIAVVAAGLVALALDHLFQIPPQLLPEARVVVLMGGFAVATALVGGVFGGVLAGLHRFDIDGALEIAITVLRAVAVVAALRAGHGLIALSAIQLTISLLRGAAAFALVRRLYPELALRRTGRSRESIRQLLSFSLYASLIHFSGMLIYHTDALVIGALLPIGFVTFYAIASSLAEYARQLTSAVSRIVTPRASAAQADGGAGAVRQVLTNIAPAATLLTVPIAMTFLLRGESFINLWMGPEYGPRSGPVLALLAIVVWLAGGRMIAAATMMGINRHRLFAFVVGAEAASNLALSIALVAPLGLLGVALGTVLPSLAVSVGFIPWYLSRELQVHAGRFLTRVWLQPSLACGGFAAGTYAMERWMPVESLGGFFLQTIVLLPLVPAGAALVMLTRGDRATLRARLAELRGRTPRTGPRGLDVPIPLPAPLADRDRR